MASKVNTSIIILGIYVLCCSLWLDRTTDAAPKNQERATPSCDGVMIANQCLRFNTEQLSWKDAKERCASQNGRLAVLNDTEGFQDYARSNYGSDKFWLGCSDSANEGEFVWINGQPLGELFPWGTQQPDNGGNNEDCLMWGYKGAYNDDPCQRTLGFVCEICDRMMIANQCLKFSTEQLSWKDAKERCESQDARLAVLNEPEEFKKFAIGYFGRHSFWLGGSDIANEGEFVWITGQPLGDQFPWGTRQPNNLGNNEDCLMWGHDGAFKDDQCHRTLGFVCDHFQIFDTSAKCNSLLDPRGSIWKEECYTCRCDVYGEPMCIREPCSAICTPGSRWKDGCNECWCDYWGYPNCLTQPCPGAVCYPECVNGVCTAHNTCTCNPGWEGAYCTNGDFLMRAKSVHSTTDNEMDNEGVLSKKAVKSFHITSDNEIDIEGVLSTKAVNIVHSIPDMENYIEGVLSTKAVESVHSTPDNGSSLLKGYENVCFSAGDTQWSCVGYRVCAQASPFSKCCPSSDPTPCSYNARRGCCPSDTNCCAVSYSKTVCCSGSRPYCCTGGCCAYK